jgi:hypothetical protein
VLLRRKTARLKRRAASSHSQRFLLQLALSLLGQIEMFLDHFGGTPGQASPGIGQMPD